MRTRLSNSALAALPEGISAPGYDRSALGPGILHVGMGNFHRAHQAVYADDLDAAQGFYEGILGLTPIQRVSNRHVFFRVGGAVLLVFNPAKTTDPPGNPRLPRLRIRLS